MPLPIPEPGLVLCYEFLWSREHQAGHEQGEKKRPSVVVLKTVTEAGQISVTVAPITHSRPRAETGAIEMPPKGQAAPRSR
jgi:mRNA-degrading endonuclease toxin of MazEF toxin-antitoxin module